MDRQTNHLSTSLSLLHAKAIATRARIFGEDRAAQHGPITVQEIYVAGEDLRREQEQAALIRDLTAQIDSYRLGLFAANAKIQRLTGELPPGSCDDRPDQGGLGAL